MAGGKRGRPKKNPFDDLPEEFKTTMDSATEAERRNVVARVAMAEEENKKNMKEDQDLAEKKSAVKEASVQYRAATKMNSLKIRYIKDILEASGKQTT